MTRRTAEPDCDCTLRRGGSHPLRRSAMRTPLPAVGAAVPSLRAALLAARPVVLTTLAVVASACVTESPPEETSAAATSAAATSDTRDGPLSGYHVRMDSESSDPALFELVEDDDGIRIQTGPAGIAYREDDAVTSGDMQVQATFRQFDAPVGYREAYGIFVGGIDLDGPELEYTYLLIRPTGEFLVKRRIGTITETMVDWTAHPSVQGVDEEGDEPVNTLGIDVHDGRTHFVVNGDVVHEESASRIRPYGIAGVRVNHRLDVRVDDWFVRRTSES